MDIDAALGTWMCVWGEGINTWVYICRACVGRVCVCVYAYIYVCRGSMGVCIYMGGYMNIVYGMCVGCGNRIHTHVERVGEEGRERERVCVVFVIMWS